MHGATTSTSFGFKVASPATDWTVISYLDVPPGVPAWKRSRRRWPRLPGTAWAARDGLRGIAVPGDLVSQEVER